MRRVLQFVLLAAGLAWCVPTEAAISKVSADCTGTSSCTTTGNLTGDLEIAYAGRDGSATAPTTATGWTSVGTATINGTGSNDSAVRIACKVATGANEASNTFTNATSLVIQVYRGQVSGSTATCASVILGTPSFFTTTVNTTSTTETFNSVTNQNSDSWDVGFGYAPAATAGMGTAPSGMTNRNTSGTIMGGHDTNAGVASFSSANVTITTASRILTVVVEIKAACASGVCFVQAVEGVGSGTAVTSLATSSMTTSTGNLVVALVGALTTTVSSVTDGTNTYVQGTSCRVVSNGEFVDIWYAKNITGTTSAITVNYGASIQYGNIVAMEFSGASTTSPFELCTTQTNTSNTSITSGSFSPAASGNGNAVLVRTPGGGISNWTAGANYTLSHWDTGTAFGTEHRSNAPSGAQTASMSWTTSQVSLMTVGSFQVSGGGGGPTPVPKLMMMGVGD